jgi:hypothetical protein
MNRRDFFKSGVGALAAAGVAEWAQAAVAQEQGQAGRPPASGCTELVDKALKQNLMDYLADLGKWIKTLDVGGNNLKNTRDTRTSIFINGNFARVLMALHRIAGNKADLEEALRWCDTFCKIQQITRTSTGNDAGYWPDCGPQGNIYFGDAGTAATALAIGHRFADAGRQPAYLKAAERMARFVVEGCEKDPQALGREAAKSWVIREGPDRGALGCGYYEGHLSLKPYTIASATTGGAFFSELFGITGKSEHRDVAAGATRWLLKIRKDDGEIPYILDGRRMDTWPLDTLSYCTEAFVAADTYLKDADLQAAMRSRLRPTVDWFLARQNPDGSWGKLRSADQQRSPRAVTLLTWYQDRVKPDERIAASVRKYCRFLLKPGNSKAYGVKELVRTSGFVGLAVAEVVLPGSTF